MRILFTTQPAAGHLHPLVPLAQALVTAGHEVKFACSASFRPTVEACGFSVISAGVDWLESAGGAAFPRIAEVAAAEGHSAALTWVNEEVFASATAGPMADDVLAMSRDWQPDVIVRDQHEYGGYLAAETLGLPHASVEVGVFRPAYWRDSGVARQLDRLRAAHGLPLDPDLVRLHHFLHLSLVPPRYQDPAARLPVTAHVLRPVVFDRSGDEALPAWITDLPNQTTVYATLGTVTNRRPDIFNTIITGLRNEPLNLILTVGRNQDPSDFGRQPPNVHIERYIPQSLLLPHCHVLVSHGGFNSVLGAIINGLPQVVIPLTADQPDHARRCAALGVGRVILPEELSSDAVRKAVREVLTDSAWRDNAARLGDEMAALPEVEHGVTLLERLAAEKVPLVPLSYSH